MYTLKAFRGAATFEQRFTNHDAYLDQTAWLKANGWTIGSHGDFYTRVENLRAKFMTH